MNISPVLLSNRTIRFGLMLVAGLVGVSLWLPGETTALKVLGSVGAILIALLLKVVSEQFVLLKGLEDSSQAAKQMAETSTRLLKDTRAELGEAQHHLARVEAAMFDDGGSFSRAQQDTKDRIEEVRRNMSTAMDDLSIRVDELVAAGRPVRRHRTNSDVNTRELGLRDSLAGLNLDGETGMPD